MDKVSKEVGSRIMAGIRSRGNAKKLKDRDYRLEWAEKVGLGFDLIQVRTGKLGKLIVMKQSA